MPANELSRKGGPAWTPTQRDAITATGENLLVSAAAGSGKTAVLAERCAFLVCDATPRCGVDELLVVTYTEAAAAEMRGRIEQTIRRRGGHEAPEYLIRQLALVERAQVGTIHAFCARVLREHFQVLGLDPSFRILDGDEANLLRLELARELLADRFDAEGSDAFEKFVDRYGDGDDARIVTRLVRAHDMLRSVVSPEEWTRSARQRISEATKDPLEASRLGLRLREMLLSELASLGKRCVAGADSLSRSRGLEPLDAMLTEIADGLRGCYKILRTEGADALAETWKEIKWPKAPRTSNDTPGAAAAKEVLASIRKSIGPDSHLAQLLAFSSADWQNGLARMLPDAQIFLELLPDLEERYALEKRRARLVDFSDLERHAFDILRDRDADVLRPSAIARLYHRQFKHVLVDEYQDVNELQDAILSLVSHERAADVRIDPPNLFFVGDVKQSIYRFRLAEPARFLDRMERYQITPRETRGRVVALPDNFRSRPPLLEAINAVFERLMTRDAAEIEYDASHRLVGVVNYPTGDGMFRGSPIEMHVLDRPPRSEQEDDDESDFDRTDREAVFVARRIRQLVESGVEVFDRQADGSLLPRPLRYGDCAVLLRSMRLKAGQFAAIFRQFGVPVHAESRSGFFEATEVRDVLALLHVLDNRRQDIPLATLIRSPLSEVDQPEAAMARAVLAYRDEPDPPPFHATVARYAIESTDESARQLARLFERLDAWRDTARRRPVAELIWSIYESTGYLTFLAGLPAGEQRRANLLGLHDRARQFGDFQRQDLGRFLQFLESLKSDTDLGQPSVGSEAQDAVQVMSIHASKGLEFPVVVVPDLGKQFNLSDTQGSILFDRHAYLGMQVIDETRLVRYPSLASVVVNDRLRSHAIAEELRVLYVAMTRAREHLILVGTAEASAVEKWQALFGTWPGALPTDIVQGARTPLDWLGAVQAAIAGAGPGQIDLRQHDQAEISDWIQEAQELAKPVDASAPFARLRPLDPPAPADDVATRVIERLQFQYPNEIFTTSAASRSVTWLTKQDDSRESAAAEDVAREGLLARRTVGENPPTAADIGTATHVVMQHLDFSQTTSADQIERQIGALIHNQLLSPREAREIDYASIHWFLGTALGRSLVAADPNSLLRELPVFFAKSLEHAPPSEPMDRVMIRGRIDLLLREPQKLTIIDYKTDRASGTALAERIALYRGQLALYREALSAIAALPVSAHLVYLSARRVEEV